MIVMRTAFQSYRLSALVICSFCIGVSACTRGAIIDAQLAQTPGNKASWDNGQRSSVGGGGVTLLAQPLPVAGSPEDFRRLVTGIAYFEADSTALTPDAHATLARQIAWADAISQPRSYN
jgi:hypothetical protein